MIRLIVFIILFCGFSYLHAQSLGSKIDSFQIKKDKEHQEFLQLQLEKWCNKRRSLQKCKDIETSLFWEKFNISIAILNKKKDWRGYYFKLKNDTLPNRDEMIKILICFKDY